MKHIFILLILLSATLYSCKDECQDALDEVFTAKEAYEAAPSSASCLSYKNAMEQFLTYSCKSNSQSVNYESIFTTYLEDLNCDTAFYSSTCNNGVLDGDETGIDCGGSCAPCTTAPVSTCTDGIMNGNEIGVDCGGPDCAPCSFHISCVIDNVNWQSGGNGVEEGQYIQSSNSTNYGIVLGQYTNFTSGGIEQISIQNFYQMFSLQSYPFVGGTVPSNYPASNTEVCFTYQTNINGSGSIYTAVPNSGQMTITNHDPINNTLTGTFSLRAYENTDTIDITNGSFHVSIQ